MLSKFKTFISISLSLLIILGTVIAIPITVSGFAERNSAPSSSDKNFINVNYGGYNKCIAIDGRTGFVLPNCTGYAWGRAREILGSSPNLCTTNACDWYGYNKNNGFYPYGNVPQLGAIACWSGGSKGLGHVAVVENISDNKVSISESGYQWETFYRREIYNNFYVDSSYVFQGYIYILGNEPHTHNFYYAGAESEHPHYKFYKCACGAKEVHYNELYKDPNCTICNPTYCVSEGEYHIVSALDNSLGLNVAYNSTETGANVQLWDNMDEGNSSSLVNVKYLGSGYYTMTFMNSGKNLDVVNAGTASGTNVAQCEDNGHSAQKWIISPTGDGYFYIVTKLNTNLFLDVSGGSKTAGANVQIHTGNFSPAQKWKFIASGVSTGQTIKNGEYTIASAIDNNYGLNIAGGSTENGGNIHIWNNIHTNDANARVSVEYLDYGLYKLTFKRSNKVLDIEGSHNTSASNIHQWDYVSNNNQKWILKSAGDGYYYIIGKGSGLAVDISGGSVANGTNIQAHVLNYSNAQKWKFELVPEKITYDANGGNIFNDTVTSVQINGINSSRDEGKIIVYTSSMYSKTPTNIYGDEFSFDKNGKKVGKRSYGTEAKLDVPSGGFVISKQAMNSFALHTVAGNAEYAYCDYNNNIVFFYNNEHDYLAGTKTVIPGEEYGSLTTPKRTGWSFDGWYTSAEGGTQITSETIYDGVTTLYAHWSVNVASEPTTTEATSVPVDTTTPSTQAQTTESVTTSTEPTTLTNVIGDVNFDGGMDVRDATAIQRYIAKMISFTNEQKIIADVNKDNSVDVRDATTIKRAIAKIITLG